MKHLIAGLILALAVGAGGCASPDAAVGGGGGARDAPGDVVPPDGEPYVTGPVLSVSRNKPVTEDCVDPDPEADPEDSVSSDDPPVCDPNPTTLGSIGLADIVARVERTVPIVREGRDGEYEPIALDAIAKGDMVAIWISGPIAESYPAQGAADFVVVQARQGY